MQLMNDRRSGRTIRLVDEAVQTLFVKGEVYFHDHHYGESIMDHQRACRFGFNILIRRLFCEHGGLENFSIDKERFYVKLKSK